MTTINDTTFYLRNQVENRMGKQIFETDV